MCGTYMSAVRSGHWRAASITIGMSAAVRPSESRLCDGIHRDRESVCVTERMCLWV
jgi:hypothetical protein